jgi:hypothetical protein
LSREAGAVLESYDDAGSREHGSSPLPDARARRFAIEVSENPATG